MRLLHCQLHILLPVRILSHYRCLKASSETYYQGIPPVPTAPYPAFITAHLLQVSLLRTLSLLCTLEDKVPTFFQRSM